MIIDTLNDVWFGLKNIYRGIKNLVRWAPIIYQDRDWDHGFMLRLMHFKLRNMVKFFESDKVHIIAAKSIAKRIKIAAHLVDRLAKDDYVDFSDICSHAFGSELRNTLDKIIAREKMLRKQDEEMLIHYLKHYANWWD
jgi:hypothetical protein